MEDQEISYSNALGSGISINTDVNKEVTANCIPISDNEMKLLQTALEQAEDNQVRIELVMDNKEGKLFSTKQILAVCNTTPSLKTRKAILHMIGPRITDVKNSAAVVNLFSASADRSEIEGIFRTVSTLKSSKKLASSPATKSPITMGGRGKGGRGGGRMQNAAAKVVMLNRATSKMKSPQNKSKNENVSSMQIKEKKEKQGDEENNKLNNYHKEDDSLSSSTGPVTCSSTTSTLSDSSQGQIFFAPSNDKCDNSLSVSNGGIAQSPPSQNKNNSITEDKTENVEKDQNIKREIRRARSSIRMANPLSLLGQSISPRDSERIDESTSSTSSSVEQNDSVTKKEIRRARSSIRMANPLSLLGQSMSPRDSSTSPTGDSFSLPPSPPNDRNKSRASKRKSRYILSGSISLTEATISEHDNENAHSKKEKEPTNEGSSEESNTFSQKLKAEPEESKEEINYEEVKKSSGKSNKSSFMSSLFNKKPEEGEGVREDEFKEVNLSGIDSSGIDMPGEDCRLENESTMDEKSPNVIHQVVKEETSKESKNENLTPIHNEIKLSSSKRPSSFLNADSTKEETLKDAKLIEEKAQKILNQDVPQRLKDLIEVDVKDRELPNTIIPENNSEESAVDFLSYEDLLKFKAEKKFYRVKPDQLEKYLSEEEFVVVMGMDKETFYSLVPWKRKKIKQDKGLF